MTVGERRESAWSGQPPGGSPAARRPAWSGRYRTSGQRPGWYAPSAAVFDPDEAGDLIAQRGRVQAVCGLMLFRRAVMPEFLPAHAEAEYPVRQVGQRERDLRD